MYSNEDYLYWKKEVEPIVVDTYVAKPTKEGILRNDYFYQQGLWTDFEDFFYFYDRKRLAKHRGELLSICKRLPKYHKPSDEHAGTISSFTLLPPPEQFNNQTPDITFAQLTLSHHFANLVCGAGIASIAPVTDGRNKAFLIVLDNKYRAYYDKEGFEPFEE